MNKLHTYIFRLLLISILSLYSCEKLEIPNEEHSNEVEKENLPNSGNESADKEEEPTYDAYSVSDIINMRFTKTEDVYVVGYIVGYTKNTSMDFCHFSRGDVETNILIADAPIDTFATKCIPVQLTTSTIPCKATRTALNLAKNDVLGQKVRLQGDIDYYMGTFGLLKARNHTILENDFNRDEYEEKKDSEDSTTDSNGDNTQEEPEDENDIPEDTPDTPDDEQEDDPTTDEWAELVAYIDSHGMEDAPFSITDFKTTLPEYLSHFGASEIGHAGMKDVYICGYIVGYVKSNNINKAFFGTEGAVQTNIVLADSPEEQDISNCIAVELSLSSNRHKEVREALNLADHPENYRRRFIIYGNITDSNDYYMGTLGLRSARAYMPCDDE